MKNNYDDKFNSKIMDDSYFHIIHEMLCGIKTLKRFQLYIKLKNFYFPDVFVTICINYSAISKKNNFIENKFSSTLQEILPNLAIFNLGLISWTTGKLNLS